MDGSAHTSGLFQNTHADVAGPTLRGLRPANRPSGMGRSYRGQSSPSQSAEARYTGNKGEAGSVPPRTEMQSRFQRPPGAVNPGCPRKRAITSPYCPSQGSRCARDIWQRGDVVVSAGARCLGVARAESTAVNRQRTCLGFVSLRACVRPSTPTGKSQLTNSGTVRDPPRRVAHPLLFQPRRGVSSLPPLCSPGRPRKGSGFFFPQPVRAFLWSLQ